MQMRSLSTTVFVAALSGALAFAGSALAQQSRTLKMQSAVPTASTTQDAFKFFADRVDKLTGGNLKIDALPGGAVVPPFEILDAAHKKVIDGAYGISYWWIGKSTTATLFANTPAGIFGMDAIDFIGWVYEGGGLQLWNEFYQNELKMNLVAFPSIPPSPQALGWFKRPIKDVADFKTMKYRSPPGITGEIFKEMGISAVALPGGEIVPAAQRGTIDAAEWIGPADDRNLGLHTVWKNYYLQGLHQSTDIGEVLFNKTWWDKQPADVKEILKGAALASMMETYSFNVYRNAQAIVELREKHNVQILDTPKEFYPEFVKATNIVLDRYAAKDPFFKEVLDSQRNFAKTVVPYWTKILDLYSELGNSALKK